MRSSGGVVFTGGGAVDSRSRCSDTGPSTMGNRLLQRLLFLVSQPEVNGLIMAGIMARQQGSAPEFPEKIREPQATDSKGRQEVQPVFSKSRAGERRHDLVILKSKLHEQNRASDDRQHEGRLLDST